MTGTNGFTFCIISKLNGRTLLKTELFLDKFLNFETGMGGNKSC